MFFVFESSIVNGAQANGVTVKATRDEARMLWHQIRASQLANENATYSIAIIFDENGSVIASEKTGEAIQ
jgi:hypothetical protein